MRLVVVSRVRGDGRRDGFRSLSRREIVDAEEFGIEAVARLESLVHRPARDVRVTHDGVEPVTVGIGFGFGFFGREGGESFRLGDGVAKRGGVAAVGEPERASPERGAGDDADELGIGGGERRLFGALEPML